ncbi:MAG: TlpA family protein disulfide reductase [Bryobacteraceae bacterium]
MKINNALRAILVTLTLVFIGVVTLSLRDTSAKEGGRAPAFAIVTDQGQRITPTSFGGKVLVLNFWATWCPPCIQEIPSLSQFQREFAKSGVVVVGISVDTSAQKYKTFLSRIPVSFATARDPSGGIAAQYGTFQYPESYIIENGRVVRKFAGAENWTSDDITQFVRGLL